MRQIVTTKQSTKDQFFKAKFICKSMNKELTPDIIGYYWSHAFLAENQSNIHCFGASKLLGAITLSLSLSFVISAQASSSPGLMT